jgi:glycosyltransferase involved in cell wall biosynthesis
MAIAMRIGIEAQRIFRTKKHGMDMVALELVKHLHEVDQKNEYVVFVKEDEDPTCLPSFPNVELKVLPASPYPVWEQWLLPKAAKKAGVELLHCTSNTAPVFPGMPLVITLHDIIYLEKLHVKEGTTYQKFGNLYRRWNVPSVVDKAEIIITVSEFEKNRICDHFGYEENRVEAIYNGVSRHFKRVEDSQKLAEAKKKFNLPDKFIFFLGNTDPKKNVHGVLKALSILKHNGELPCKLLMLDINREYLARVANEINDPEILDEIQFTGYIPNADLPAIYSQASLFLYPSLRESFGIPMIEAMRCGVPVITSVTSCMPEVAGGAALLTDPFQPEHLAASIRDLIYNESKKKELVALGYERSKLFSWAENARKTVDIYHQILNN